MSPSLSLTAENSRPELVMHTKNTGEDHGQLLSVRLTGWNCMLKVLHWREEGYRRAVIEKGAPFL